MPFNGSRQGAVMSCSLSNGEEAEKKKAIKATLKCRSASVREGQNLAEFSVAELQANKEFPRDG